MWQNIAFALIGIGTLILFGWAVKDFFMASEIPLLLRIAIGAISVGILVLLGIALRERIAKARKENFKEIKK
jgi:ABC-type uncharacterized transport system YnjBCD permease subunit